MSHSEMEASCLDCPFRRDADERVDDPFDFVDRCLFGDTDEADIDVHICDESGSTCYGNLMVIRNGSVSQSHNVLADAYDVASELEPDTETYFFGAWDFIAYHENGQNDLGWYRENYGEGNKTGASRVGMRK